MYARQQMEGAAVRSRRSIEKRQPKARAAAFAALLGTTAMIAATLALVPAASAAEPGCAGLPAAEAHNAEARRLEQGSQFLPDCRAFELVSQPYQPGPQFGKYYDGYPPVEVPGELTPQVPVEMPMVQFGAFTAADGEAALFAGVQPNSESGGYETNLALRTATGWNGENLESYSRTKNEFLCVGVGYAGFSANMEQIVWWDGEGGTEGENNRIPTYGPNCGHAVFGPGQLKPEVPVPLEAGGLFLRDTSNGVFTLLNPVPASAPEYNPFLDAVSADGSHAVFQSRQQLAEGAPNAEAYSAGTSDIIGSRCRDELGNVYVWSGGTNRLLTVLPEGEAVRGTLAGGHAPKFCGDVPNESASFTHALSTHGERILFYAGGGFEDLGYTTNAHVAAGAPYIEGDLYLREHPGAEESTAGECTSAEQKTEAAKACTVQIDVPQAGAPVGAKSGGGQFQWANAETTRILFTDEEKLLAGATAEAGKPDLYEYDLERPEGERLTDLTANVAEPADVLGVSGASEDGSYVYFAAKGVLAGNEDSHGAKAVAGEANLYVRHGGSITFIATLNASEGDQCDWTTYCLTSRVSANGKYIAFDSIERLTGYDNRPTHPESCERLTGTADSPCIEAFRYAVEGGAESEGELTCATCNPSGAPPAAELGGWAVIEQPNRNKQGGGRMDINDAVSNVGQVFFETMEPLAGEEVDTNKTWDVYEYDGGEGVAAQDHLISTGKDGLPSYFVNATADGKNVFFLTDQKLLAADTAGQMELYDARAGGGFASQDETVVPEPCKSLEGCRSPLSEPPAAVSVASAELHGSGNLQPPAEQKQGEHGKQVTKSKPFTRRQKLRRALKRCSKRFRRSRHRRRVCERRARRRYGAKSRHGRHGGAR
jgi:hypothetical protein